MIKIHIFHTGEVRVDRAIPYREKNPLAVTGFLRGEDKKITLPVSCYLIEHPKGRVLIDSGWSSRYVNAEPKRFFGALGKISMPIIKEGESVDCRLSEMGLKPSDIDWLFLSHLDFDHTSGIELLYGVKNVRAADEEIKDARGNFIRYVRSTWSAANLQPFYYAQTGLGPVGKSYDVFGDGTVQLVNTPGHSHGHFSAVIRNGEKYAVLAGDAVYTQRSIAEHILPGFTVDVELAKKSVDWVCRCAADENCVLVAPNHDPETKPQIIEL